MPAHRRFNHRQASREIGGEVEWFTLETSACTSAPSTNSTWSMFRFYSSVASSLLPGHRGCWLVLSLHSVDLPFTTAVKWSPSFPILVRNKQKESVNGSTRHSKFLVKLCFVCFVGTHLSPCASLAVAAWVIFSWLLRNIHRFGAVVEGLCSRPCVATLGIQLGNPDDQEKYAVSHTTETPGIFGGVNLNC